MASIPAHDPPVPFLGLIPGGFSHGRMIRIKGYMKPYGDRVSINLMCGPSTNPLDDVALHIDIRPSEGSIVRNHHSQETGWGNLEERYGGCPILPGQPYEILILAQNQCYKIAVNGVHFCEFSHRLPLYRVQYLYILHDTSISYVGLEGDVPQHQATAPPLMAGPPIPPPTNYAPNYSPPPPYGMAVGQPPIIHQQIQPGPPPGSYYNPNAALSYGGIPPPYGATPQIIPTAPYYNAPITTAQPNTGYVMQQGYIPESNRSNNNMLKYAAVAGGAGLTGLALGKILSDSDCCDSD